MPASVVTVDRDAIRRMFTGDPLTKRHANDILRPVLGDRPCSCSSPTSTCSAASCCCRRSMASACAHTRTWSPAGGGRAGPLGGRAHVTVLPRAQDLTLEVILQIVLGMRDDGARRGSARSTTR